MPSTAMEPHVILDMHLHSSCCCITQWEGYAHYLYLGDTGDHALIWQDPQFLSQFEGAKADTPPVLCGSDEH